MALSSKRNPRVPGSTYRIQFNKNFTFRQALGLVEYWHSLGITDLYAAPFLVARLGSVHGYDVVDPRELNPEIGTRQDLSDLHEALASRGMGMLMDVVPNHMCVDTNDNVWWNDVLENGPSSPYAKYFDIDWRPPKAELRDKVLLPVLGEQYGKVLESGELRVGEAGGAFSVSYGHRSFPLGPATYPLVLQGVLARLQAGGDDPVAVARLETLIGAARRLPSRSDTDPKRMWDRQREKEIVKARLDALLVDHPAARRAVDAELDDINGQKGLPRTFDKLEHLLAEQAYRLSYWRVAAEHINYRRFFEINDLAALAIEEPEVLETVHARAFELLKLGWVTGLRIDHVDGLKEPRQYLDTLAERTRGAYVVVEKILGADEELPSDWAADGTTGYEFLNTLNGLFVSRAGEKPLRATYDGLRTVLGAFADVAYDARRLILRTSMSSELSVLARRLDRVSEQHRWSRDFTIGTLQEVLASTIACFRVYRTYITPGDAEASTADVAHIRAALDAAKRRSASIDASGFEFLGDVLTKRDPEGLSERERAERRDFILRFQELTGPVMAKGIEDTTFFRYIPLLSLNEVGGGPEPFGISVDEFHRSMGERARSAPASLSTTTTHDTKRSEDDRARLHVLSEIPAEWALAVAEWRILAAPLKTTLNDQAVPDADDEYCIYQTLVGACPAVAPEGEALVQFASRVEDSVAKAIREAKRQTSWINPNLAYERATRLFVSRLLDPAMPFLPRLIAFVSRVTLPGFMTSLAQLVIKTTAPGVPDFYQGTELWDFGMGDPDNRRPVDFVARERLLADLVGRAEIDRARLVAELWQTPEDGRVKLFMTRALLAARRASPALFARGSYQALAVEGKQRDHLVAFARGARDPRDPRDPVAWTVTGRFFTRLASQGAGAPEVWADTRVRVPPALAGLALENVFTGAPLRLAGESVRVAELFAQMPFGGAGPWRWR